MNQLQDLIGSMIIGGIIILMLVSFNGNVMQSAAIQTFKTNVQGNLTTVTDIMEYDFRKMGYRVSPTNDSAITYADTSKIVFKGDFNNDGSIDTLQYYLDTVKASLTPNPSDKVLHRKLNGLTTQSFYVGISKFFLQYFDSADKPIAATPIASTSSIKSVKVAISIASRDRIFDPQLNRKSTLGNPFIDTTYAGAYWERKVKPQNVR